MRGSFRVHSLLGLAAFLGWSLLVNARERLIERRPGAHTHPPPTRTPAQLADRDRLRWN
jgi:hypothetical protein